jgi:hypothetical protein
VVELVELIRVQDEKMNWKPLLGLEVYLELVPGCGVQ